MASNNSVTAQYEALPKLLKLILQIIFGLFIGGIYRIVRFLETGNVITLVAGIVCLVSGVGNFIAWIVDLYTEITMDRITFFAD